ncbi:GNAT family N-acetyltransferase [Arachidicoccus soli]|uniref:GNAT family N-acetyltransferase n=1 Tax=Arachidicoccus soli TaxID=2341117 RepID=A0A386HMS9_9BACT|nr:GNAT family N-acetyltransferase [Arachidicoccus soli]AYD46801.1 GNAT family N-acetyltransferase [Arachidicoccus soli]
MNLEFICKKFDELSLIELYRILQIRNQVFYVEQRCDDLDLDDRDQQSYHLMVYNDDILCGYARLLPPGLAYKEISIGRVAVSINYRGENIGRRLMEASITDSYKLFGKGTIKISGQLYLQKFYESLGFEKISEVYLEAGIEHIKMKRSYHETI